MVEGAEGESLLRRHGGVVKLVATGLRPDLSPVQALPRGLFRLYRCRQAHLDHLYLPYLSVVSSSCL